MRDTDDTSLPHWLRRTRCDAAVEPEPADYGTAFGLDMSLLPPDAACDPEPGAAPDAWLQRLGLKR